MNNIFKAGLMAAAIGVAGWHPSSQAAGFTGIYSPSNWTVATNGGTGSVDTSGAPNTITLTGTSYFNNRVSTDYTTIASGSGKVSFDWAYSSEESWSAYDRFGYLLNGAFTPLSDGNVYAIYDPVTGMNEPLQLSGTYSFDVTSGDSFGFRMDSDPSVQSSTTISNFSAPVAATPVPGPLPVLGVLAAFGFSRRLRARIHAARPA